MKTTQLAMVKEITYGIVGQISIAVVTVVPEMQKSNENE
jgi:hypothetical protein